MSEPSTPTRVVSDVERSVPWGSVSRKSLQLYVTPPNTIRNPVPTSSLRRYSVFIVFPSPKETIR